MVIRAALNEAARCLKEKGNPTPRLDAAVLLCYVLGKDRGYLVTHDQEPLAPAAKTKYREIVAKRAEGMPGRVSDRRKGIYVASVYGKRACVDTAW